LKSHYVPELDGIRAISVLLVITAHMNSDFWHPAVGGLGVYVFFVLSGYLITSLAIREEAETGTLSFVGFYLRRTFRIFPLYYLVLAVYCILIFGLGVSPERRVMMVHNMGYYLTYFQEVPFFRGTLPTFGHSWSLGIEEKFYLFWPIIAFWFLRGAPKVRLWVACGLALLAPFLGNFVAPYGSILAGCALAFAFRDLPLRKVLSSGGPAFAYLSFALLFLFQVLVMPRWDSNLSKFTYSVVVTCWLAFVLVVPTYINRVLRSAPLVFLGKISYGIYLVHHLCLNFAEKAMHGRVIASFVLTVITSVIFAYALHITVEKPLIRLGRKLASRHSNPPLASTPAA
jgi:peptidoglycan/LPS O-acetylase OafA/YrhL